MGFSNQNHDIHKLVNYFKEMEFYKLEKGNRINFFEERLNFIGTNAQAFRYINRFAMFLNRQCEIAESFRSENENETSTSFVRKSSGSYFFFLVFVLA